MHAVGGHRSTPSGVSDGYVSSMDWTGWLGVGAAWLGVVVAVVFGVVAWRQGHAASRRAKRADEKADRLEKKLASLGADLEAIKGAAVQTRELAEDANEISRSALVGVQESHDVRWDGEWEGESYVLRNTGRDEAREVRGSVTIDGTERLFDIEHVESGGEIRLEFAELVRQHAEDARERRAADQQRGPYAPYFAVDHSWMYAPWVYIRVLWKSEGGVAHKYSPNGYQDDIEH